MATDCDSLYGLFVLTIKSSAFQTKENEHTGTFPIIMLRTKYIQQSNSTCPSRMVLKSWQHYQWKYLRIRGQVEHFSVAFKIIIIPVVAWNSNKIKKNNITLDCLYLIHLTNSLKSLMWKKLSPFKPEFFQVAF